jgi:glycolate oxidase FAD binding subunit
MTDHQISNGFTVSTVDQVVDAVRWAVSEEAPLDVAAGGTKRGLGRPIQTKMSLDVAGLTGIKLYEPEELVMAAWAGTPLSAIEAALAEKGQELAFEPADYGPLYGQDAGKGTVGGMFAANLCGPRRMKVGAARDHLLGLHAVSGRGELFKTGGRVVKNVTGYDLCKLMTGAFGTLGVMTEVTFKVLPRAETIRTLSVHGLSAGDAVAAMTRVLQSSVEATGAAFLPAYLASSVHADLKPADQNRAVGSVVFRLEGFAASVADRANTLSEMLRAYGPVEIHEDDVSKTLWANIRDASPFAGSRDAKADGGGNDALWRVSIPPAAAPGVLGAIASAYPQLRYFLDWGGGLIWIAVSGAGDGGEAAIRAAIEGAGGHATLVRGSDQLRAAVPVFQPLPDAVLALTGRIKHSFDPARVLNPGRIYAGV